MGICSSEIQEYKERSSEALRKGPAPNVLEDPGELSDSPITEPLSPTNQEIDSSKPLINVNTDPRSSASHSPPRPANAVLYPDLMELVGEVDNKKSANLQQSISLYQPDIERHRQLTINGEISDKLQKCVDKYQVHCEKLRPNRQITTKEWLRNATWWLLMYQKLNRTNTEKLQSDHKLSFGQAHANMLKAAWILYDVVLKNNNETIALMPSDDQIRLGELHDVRVVV